MISQKITEFQRSRVRIETHGSSDANPTNVITLTLPESSVDLNSLKLHFRATTTSSGTSTNVVYGKLPADASSLFSNIEVRIGGQVVQQSVPELFTIARIKNIMESRKSKQMSTDALLSHGIITSNADSVDDVDMILPLGALPGFLGEAATRILPLHHMGELTVRLTVADKSVLTHKQVNVTFGANFTGTGATSAAACSYSLSGIYATVDTVSVSPMYDQLLQDRLSREDHISIPYKSYAVFLQHGITSSHATVRAMISSGSVNRAYCVLRNGNYQTAGIKGQTYTGAVFSDTFCSNNLYFQSFNGSAQSTNTIGNLKYYWTVAGVRSPQSEGTLLDVAFDLVYGANKIGGSSAGVNVSSLTELQQGKCIFPLILNHPGIAAHQSCGYDSRQVNTPIEFTCQNITIPTVSTTTGEVASVSACVVVESSQELRLSSGRQIAIAY